MLRLLSVFLVLLLALAGMPAFAAPPVVLAAASLQESLNAAADAWVRKGHERPVISFAGSSALARQIEAGAPADLFISADEEWMDHVAARGLVRKETRATFLTNRLVLVSPVASRVSFVVGPRFPLARALGGTGRLAMADPDAVPAGRYGREALTRLGVWPSVQARVARAENVRAAMALVERGAAPLGVVYATDARASTGVRIAGWFPANSHTPITYPIAQLNGSRAPDAAGFERFLLSREGKAIFARFGFGTR
ncbi:molybdate ABC transporter substrate-binding protein [Novosphingobium sp. EMRT-2]|uniref:molybdate ABC transporter substrate-binding protein n=1 Tax=Novosphingobium sp. EMRT-2 TaxID=2571749 RepID=UPI0010BDA62E|nr:molybdate ABC transporter substrate-binding protein [Novosphingobium sp. EMRT-2]QCI92786.1 molybdate ABC transporter substrate-binding protein [Novosphingobium sp. EMRT-2]